MSLFGKASCAVSVAHGLPYYDRGLALVAS
jgi:hypothetical protein